MQFKIHRTIDLPDKRRMELYRRSPDLGSRILFFSGGSSAKPRDAFRMPAIGDIRNRLMALADRGLTGNPEIFRLFAYRLPIEANAESLEDELQQMASGNHPLVQHVSDPMRKVIRNFLQYFIEIISAENLPWGESLRLLKARASTCDYLARSRQLSDSETPGTSLTGSGRSAMR